MWPDSEENKHKKEGHAGVANGFLIDSQKRFYERPKSGKVRYVLTGTDTAALNPI